MKTEVVATCLIRIIRTKESQQSFKMLIQLICKSLLSLTLGMFETGRHKEANENVSGAPPTTE